ncbi:uncharacterized protein B0H18DRAFT_1120614 [Fomitopsis serialis]|uniref:uncharacterized protein n=1 Tax=Fomitopsis serialis TaxID=139415 RepID=UPI0020077DB9|nr:uncharacterized protein B0H18DRAFT_1120614 [Neoantrodia serialis]KAH9923091.1 hypothetical protein B0H18DRAFT_1120614 [Neoantrodia serialis]
MPSHSVTKMGIGIGGDCPLSALISFESSPTHIRGRVITVVFADRGSLQRPSCIVVHAYKPSLAFNGRMLPEDIDRMRRIAIRLDCVPAAVALYFRFAIPGTQRFRLDIQRNVQKAARDNDEFSRSRGSTQSIWKLSRDA